MNAKKSIKIITTIKMKKITFAAIFAIAAAAFSFTSCGNTPSANLKTDIDTVDRKSVV